MTSLVNVQEYQSLCSMPFKDIAAMTAQLTALDNADNFNYIMALQDICSRIVNPNRFRSKFNKNKRPKVRKKRKNKVKEKQSEEQRSWFSFLIDPFGLFTSSSGPKSTQKSEEEEESASVFSFLDPFGLFSTSSSSSIDRSDSDTKEDELSFYDEDYYYSDYAELNRRLGIDVSETVPYYQAFDYNNDPDDQMASDKNKRLAFVHYVYPRTSSEKNGAHFKSFED